MGVYLQKKKKKDMKRPAATLTKTNYFELPCS